MPINCPLARVPLGAIHLLASLRADIDALFERVMRHRPGGRHRVDMADGPVWPFSPDIEFREIDDGYRITA